MCHSARYVGHAPIREAEQPPTSDPGMRVSDAERESAVGVLREHGASGRLDVEELEQRVGAAYAARTHGELQELFRDLPGTAPAPRPVVAPARRTWIGHEWSAFAKVSLLLVAIWALSGGGYFWPAWVLVWWFCPLLLRSGPRLLRLR
jgi:hypothetical protein